MKGQESDVVKNEKSVSNIVEPSNTETIVTAENLNRSTEGLAPIHQNNTNESPIIDHPSPKRIESENLNITRDEVNQTIKADRIKKSVRKTSSDKNGGMALLGILFALAVLIMPPLLFSVGAYWLDVSALDLVFIWLIWIAGIVGVFFLFSGVWPIILSCLIWNIVYMIIVGIVVLINA
ncbi:MAG: hypothetical protein QE487_12430 [Fluviicola sp.]|nr:hypothetical protein [Fluviicola sp.]